MEYVPITIKKYKIFFLCLNASIKNGIVPIKNNFRKENKPKNISANSVCINIDNKKIAIKTISLPYILPFLLPKFHSSISKYKLLFFIIYNKHFLYY